MVGKELSRWTFNCIGTDTLFLFSMLEYLQVNIKEGGDATAVTTHPGRRVGQSALQMIHVYVDNGRGW